ncbi:nucleolar complex-associated protein-domain-containing protein [Pseudomassariella vexata]|uniref:Nucleolar complex-associated protein 3 n=1 Tax=Pseudomassariella vexata TaxID=1141098 RepID=A0A1Y2DIQ4_9PEZI|nr:nucleolar complex-associated protein-domain-containing protein [Pseudomassariella vexata]ORY59101.1 nucleolar complex-associated protein-domain-containing protein [Pseudomassariella vexata]
MSQLHSFAMASRPSKKRKLTPPQSEDEEASSRSTVKAQKAFFKNASSWDLEQDYETKARKGKKKEKESTRLPIKLADGRVHQVHVPVEEAASVASDEDWLDGDDASEDEKSEDDEPAYMEPDIPEQQQILEAKEELARIALMLNETPEENSGAFRAIAKIGQSRIEAIQKLTLATQLAVYKDVIPGYRIRPAAENMAQEKLSKDVRSLRSYEQALVSGYQNYIKDLARHAKLGHKQQGAKSKGPSLANIAITCACTLLTTVPHFNFRSELLKILVSKLSKRIVDDDFNKCLRAIETLFQDDEEGRPAMEAVSLLSRMMRARDYRIDESVLNLFLHLRLLSEFSGKASKDRVDHDHAGPSSKRQKQEKKFRTKRDRKAMKEQKALQKDMDNADALVSHEERDRMQSETLKLVFATYFRILKARMPHLMGAVLEGLAKYSHLINQDFFGDLLEALKDLIRHSEEDEEEGEEDDNDYSSSSVRNPTREGLLCTVTAFALLAGQDAHNARADLHLDLSFFTTHLFQTLFPLSLHADLELGAKSLHLPDPDSSAPHPASSTARNRVNLHTTTVLLIRCLTSILIPPWNIRSVPPLRLAAFTKQLMTASLHMPEKSTQAVLALLADVGGTHGRKISALWNTEERKGDGMFNPMSDSVEASNPFATTVWEGEILRKHYCPKVREGVKIVEKAMVHGR